MSYAVLHIIKGELVFELDSQAYPARRALPIPTTRRPGADAPQVRATGTVGISRRDNPGLQAAVEHHP